MPKFDVTYTVSPMQVTFSVDGEGEDIDQLHNDAITKAEKALNDWLWPYEKHYRMHQSPIWPYNGYHGIEVTYLEYDVHEVKEVKDGDNQ